MLTDLTAEDAGRLYRPRQPQGGPHRRLDGGADGARRPARSASSSAATAISCQETRGDLFRSYFREHAPEFRLLEPLINLEDARIAHEATHDLMAGNPDLVGIYICGGGIEGVIDAARQETAHAPVAIVCNELTAKTRAALIDGVLTAVISTPTPLLAARAVDAMVRAMEAPAPEPPGQILVPFELYVSENI